MDLIYTDSVRNDMGVLLEHELDLAIGEENNFVLNVSTASPKIEPMSLIYIEGTEYGGIIDEVSVDTDNQTIQYSGRTWHGILDTHILRPDTGTDYIVLNGTASQCVIQCLSRVGLGDFFTVASSSIAVQNFRMPRFISAYKGIVKMLNSVNAKLSFSFVNKKVLLTIKPVIDFTEEMVIDSDLFAFSAKKTYIGVNHLICLGQGELRARMVKDLFVDGTGTIVPNQVFQGILEIAQTFDYPNAETQEELVSAGTERLKDLIKADSFRTSFDGTSDPYEIGDIVGVVDNVTGLSVSVPIGKKIVKISNGEVDIEYLTNDDKTVVLPIS